MVAKEVGSLIQDLRLAMEAGDLVVQTTDLIWVVLIHRVNKRDGMNADLWTGSSNGGRITKDSKRSAALEPLVCAAQRHPRAHCPGQQPLLLGRRPDRRPFGRAPRHRPGALSRPASSRAPLVCARSPAATVFPGPSSSFPAHRPLCRAARTSASAPPLSPRRVGPSCVPCPASSLRPRHPESPSQAPSAHPSSAPPSLRSPPPRAFAGPQRWPVPRLPPPATTIRPPLTPPLTVPHGQRPVNPLSLVPSLPPLQRPRPPPRPLASRPARPATSLLAALSPPLSSRCESRARTGEARPALSTAQASVSTGLGPWWTGHWCSPLVHSRCTESTRIWFTTRSQGSKKEREKETEGKIQ
ncbi:uncharacterized protein LOC133890397 [Phragmites australis]|uniref:uncharacterized protein LOC133890397 n=1 Tax=Phragmites australis TaxID=29695 RepID=UPI002D79632C|nr:uncharacterized protein LOC133890397 [Phragmites australis]